jgi:hypothetical protein
VGSNERLEGSIKPGDTEELYHQKRLKQTRAPKTARKSSFANGESSVDRKDDWIRDAHDRAEKSRRHRPLLATVE